MAAILLSGRQAWLTYRPPKKRDVRKLGTLGKNKFWSKSSALSERKKRVVILSRGGKVDRDLADWMEPEDRLEPARVFCCPVLARQFQVYFTAQALKINSSHGGEGVLVTLFDAGRAVKGKSLHKIDWRTEKAALSARLKRILGKHIVSVGMGDVEYDEDRDCWQPHFHLVIYGVTNAEIEKLRMGAYFAKRGDLRPMYVSKEISKAGWFSYMSRLMPFRKAPNSKRRFRPKDPEFRRLMRYYARRDPTEFIFRHRCIFERSSK